MSAPSFFAGFAFGVISLWIFLELIALAAKRRVPPLTKHARRYSGRLAGIELTPISQVKPVAPRQEEEPQPPLFMYGIGYELEDG